MHKAVAALAATLAALPAPAAEPPEAAQARQGLEAIERRIDAASETLTATRADYARLSGELQTTEQAIRTVRGQARRLAGHIESRRQRLRELAAAEIRLAQQLSDYRDDAARALRSAYLLSRQSPAKLVLEHERAATLSRDLHYHALLAQAATARIAELNASATALAETRAAIKLEQNRLRQLKHEAAARLSELDQLQAARSTLVSTLREDIAGREAELQRLQQDHAELSDLLATINESLARSQRPGRAFADARGRLVWPAAGQVQRLSGDGPEDGTLWDGVLIKTEPGTDVFAVGAGQVVYADWFRHLGLLLIVDHGDGYMTLYGHNQEVFTENGAIVEAGERIAATGDTGGKEASGLYFVIRHRGQALDPMQWCRAGLGTRQAGRTPSKL